MKKQQIVFCLLLMITILSGTEIVFAHQGGHYHAGDILNTWTLANGQTIRGNFSMGRGDQLVLEQLGGKKITIQISNLSEQDQKLARFKIRKLEQINLSKPEFIFPGQENTPSWGPISISVFFVLTLLFILSVIGKKITMISNYGMINNSGKLALLSITGLLILFACKKSTSTQTVTNPVTTVIIPKTSVSFIDSAFTPYKPNVTTSSDATYFYVASNGLPTHNMMVGITNWQQQVPIPQSYTGTNKWSIPLQPEYSNTPLSTKSNLMKGAVALAVNGIPIFNGLNNRGEDSYVIGELDQWGGHCGKADDYHYHAAPLHLSATSGFKPIAFALDGFAVYGSTEADGSTMKALDTCHGHTVGEGVYHYHGTFTYPHVIGAMRGKVTIDPTTPAPESQIIPQAFASPLRPATTPLNGASIIAFTATGNNGFSLTYQIGNKNGFVNYFWDSGNKYTFVSFDTAGIKTTAIYQR